MNVALIYAYWPNQPGGVTWCDLPWALRDAGLPKRLSDAGHEVVESMLLAEEPFAEEFIAGLNLARQIGEEVSRARSAGELPIILCGSCAIAAIGAIAGLGSEKTGIAWFDAHPDLNTPETTVSGLLEGMALAAVAGRAWSTVVREVAGLKQTVSLDRVALFGARDIDPAEQRLIAEHAIYAGTDAETWSASLQGAPYLYAHLDMDVHDGLEVRTNSCAVPDGPTATAVRTALCSLDKLACMAITGLDPAASGAREAADIAIKHVLAVADCRGR